MRHSMYCFATDVLDEGVETVLGNLQDRAGIEGITVAAKYHAVRDVYPHNPIRKVATLDPGVYYRPRPDRYAGSVLRPTRAPAAGGRDVLEELCGPASARGMSVDAWVVLLHSDEPGRPADAASPAIISCAEQGCFGDANVGTLCPANPLVIEFCRALVEEICTYPVETLRAESLHFHGLRHGHHHERLLEHFGEAALFILGLCFCDSCIARANSEDIDAVRVREHTKASLEVAFAGRQGPRSPVSEALSPELLTELCGDEAMDYLRVRERTIASLVASLVGVVRSAGKRLTFIDETVANMAYDDGAYHQDMGETTARWQLGLDPFAVAATGVTYELTGYLADPHEVGRLLESYRTMLPSGGDLAVVLRPGPPDCRSSDELRVKVALAAAAGCSEVNFYNYGMYRLDALDRVRAATALT